MVPFLQMRYITDRLHWLCLSALLVHARVSQLTSDANSYSQIQQIQQDYRSDNSAGSYEIYNIPDTERDALKSLYDSTQGQHWLWRSSMYGYVWNFTDPMVNPCNITRPWQGVICEIFEGEESMFHVTRLELGAYNLAGRLPASIGDLYQLRNLSLDNNLLVGTIPSSLCNLSHLYNISLSFNTLSGKLPESWSYLTGLYSLALDANYLTGPLPPSMGDLSQLSFFTCYFNHLSGTIPLSFGNLTSLRVLGMGGNELSGSLPSTLVHLTSLQFLDVGTNQLYGSIPQWVRSLTLLSYMVMANNLFTGTIPAMDTLSRLYLLDLRLNRLSGPIPTSIGKMQHLNYLYLGRNHLTGTIPSSLYDLTNLYTLNINNNSIGGTISPLLGNLVKLRTLYVHFNKLSGSLPSSIGMLTNLVYCKLDDNQFIGSIPTTLQHLRDLQLLFLQNNYFTSSLDGVFSSAMHSQLRTLELSNNQLQGRLPDELFLLPNLTSLGAVKNCFTVYLSPEICSAHQLQSLALDGMHKGMNCDDQSTAYRSPEGVTVPACMFNMTSLLSLHLVANQLVGSLPADAFVSPNLQDLSLSNNLLTGTIPSQIQDRNWIKLDLSYNRITGTLQSDFAHRKLNFTREYFNSSYLSGDALTKALRFFNDSTTSLPPFIYSESLVNEYYLNNNRLSGKIPQFFVDATNINILSGNLFACSIDKSDLPRHDSSRDVYECGSNAFDYPYYTFLALAVVVVVTVSAVVSGWCCRATTSFAITKQLYAYLLGHEHNWQRLLGILSSSDLFNLRLFFSACYQICRLSLWYASYIVMVMLPTYLILSVFYSTHTYEYAWTAGMSLLSSYVAAIVVIILFVVFAHIFSISFYLNMIQRSSSCSTITISSSRSSGGGGDGDPNNNAPSTLSLREKIYYFAIIITINIIFSIGLNIGFVYVTVYQSSEYLLAAQLMYAVLQTLWSSALHRRLIKYMAHLAVVQSSKVGIQRDYGEVLSAFTHLFLFLSLVNNIAIPCAVVLVISPNCFYHLLISPPASIKSEYRFRECLVEVLNALSVFDLNTRAKKVLQSTRGSSCLFSIPVYATTYLNPAFTYDYQCSSSFLQYYAPALVISCSMNTFFKPLAIILIVYLYNRCRANTSSYWFMLLDSIIPVELSLNTDRKNYVFFDASNVLAFLLTNVALLLTFGLAFPPLVPCFLLNMVSTCIITRIRLERFLTHLINNNNNLQHYLSVVDRECSGVSSPHSLSTVLWCLLAFSCVFYTLFVFDTLGDDVGFDRSFWVLIVMPLLLPIYLFVLCRHHSDKLREYFDGRSLRSDGVKDTEMMIIVAMDKHNSKDNHHSIGDGDVSPVIVKGVNNSDDDDDGVSSYTTTTVATSVPAKIDLAAVTNIMHHLPSEE